MSFWKSEFPKKFQDDKMDAAIFSVKSRIEYLCTNKYRFQK